VHGGELGVAAACLLAAMGHRPSESDIEESRAFAGALLLAEAIQDLRLIRKAHQQQ